MPNKKELEYLKRKYGVDWDSGPNAEIKKREARRIVDSMRKNPPRREARTVAMESDDEDDDMFQTRVIKGKGRGLGGGRTTHTLVVLPNDDVKNLYYRYVATNHISNLYVENAYDQAGTVTGAPEGDWEAAGYELKDYFPLIQALPKKTDQYKEQWDVYKNAYEDDYKLKNPSVEVDEFFFSPIGVWPSDFEDEENEALVKLYHEFRNVSDEWNEMQVLLQSGGPLDELIDTVYISEINKIVANY